MDLMPFKNLIRERSGLFFDNLREVTLKNSIQSRMSINGLEVSSKYFHLLLSNPNEFQHLISLLTINETYFFREPAHLEVLTKRLFPELISRKKAGEKIRIVSTGCSSGEEAYSLMITLMEKCCQGIQNIFSIVGVDIDSNVINKARKGIFYASSFRGFPDNLKNKYFDQVDSHHYKIKDFIRDRVEFKELNLLSDEYGKILYNVDVIFYRNVSIYFDSGSQKYIFSKLADVLNRNGYLFLSSTETFSHNIGILSLIELDGIFLYMKGEVNGGEGDGAGLRQDGKESPILAYQNKWILKEKETNPGIFQGIRSPNSLRFGLSEPSKQSVLGFSKNMVERKDRAEQSSSDAVRGSCGNASFQLLQQTKERCETEQFLLDKAFSLTKYKKYQEALIITDKLLEQNPALIKGYALKAGILINLKQFEEAENICCQILEKEQWCLEGYLLLGLVANHKNDVENALKRFKEALYVNSSCWLAHFYLAEIYRTRNENKKACREYEIVSKLLQKGNSLESGLSFFPLSHPVEEVIHLCNHHLNKLKQ